MVYLLYFTILTFGLVVGSFLNCAIYRLEKEESCLKGRSYCPNCKHTLNWQDLIPVFSFLVLGGKCRYCRKPISWQYPAVEIFTAIIFLLIFNQSTKVPFLCSAEHLNLFKCSGFLFFYFLISALLIIIFVYDLKHYIIPDKIVFPGIAIALIFNFQFLISNKFFPPSGIPSSGTIFESSIFGAVLASASFLLIFLLSRGRWIGFGDVKLAILMGLFLGWPNILFALFSAFFLGAIIGVALIIAKKKGLKSEIPFGPFLVAGTFLALFWGEKVINWYLSFLF